MRLCGLLAAAAAFFMLASVAAATTESLTLDQTSPTWGENLTFTGTFTKAEQKSFPPRIYNPTLAVSCANGWRDAAVQFGHTVNLGGGWYQGQFGYVIPQGSGTSSCTAFLEFTDGNSNTTILATTSFTVTDP